MNVTLRTHIRVARLTPPLLAGMLLLLTGCMGDHDDTPVRYTRQVVFGDSLSDVGSYAVGAIAAANGGKFTVNSIPASVQNWSERVAAQLNLPAACAAQTGLNGDPTQGLYAPVTLHDGCYNYAQGGARVTDPIGPRHKTIDPTVGYLTVPVASQIQNHLVRTGGRFSSTDVVFVMAGGNDFLWQTDAMTSDVLSNLKQQIILDTQSGACVPADANASNCIAGAIDHAVTRLSPTYMTAMELAGTQLAALINDQIAGNGAQRIVVMNLPDAGLSPSLKGRSATMKTFASTMVNAFNDKLAAGLATRQDGRVIQVNVNQRFSAWAANPAAYGFSNFTDVACNLTQPVPNLLGSSITCTTANTVPGDVSRYAFADNVHPTPYANTLLADFVLSEMTQAGWR